ncbi:MAG: Omp28-related outer membrane protein [Saprospiraceae bacterium]|nr:Omp28-related outer membrane protein [Saprospiraceae bacterium]
MKHFLFLVFVVFGTFIFGQGNKKYALIQHFTNTRCGICANNNPTYYTNIQPLQTDVHHVSIHPSVPYNNCALYLANTAEQDVLRNYYSVFGTPTFFVNGDDKSLNSINAEVIATTSVNSPIAVNVNQSIGAGSLNANVSVNTTQIPPTGSYVLYVAAVEELLNYNAPNGETLHHDVFRKMFTSASGQTISLTSTGLQTFNFSTNILANWNASEMYVLAWVQNSVTKQVLNSANIYTPVPVPSVTISTSNTTLCSGASATFLANTTNGGTNPSFQWKKNGINTGTNSATFSTNTLVNGDVITCTLTSNDPFVSTTIANSNGITPTISSSVTPTINISTSNTTICSGTNTTFTAIGTNGGNAPLYQWKLNGNPVGNNNINYTNNSLINGDVISCDFTSNATCTTSNIVPSNTLNMMVNPIVTPSIAVSTPTNTICSGSSITFNTNITFGGSTPGYQWKKNGSNVGINSMTYVDNTLNNGDIITCTLTSNASCVTTNMVNSNTLPITVNANVTPTIQINTSATNICTNTNVLFTASATNGGLNPGYQWKKNGISTGSNSATYSDNALINQDVISCVLNSSATCLTTNNLNSNLLTMTVNANVTPTVQINTSATNICANTNVLFTASATYGGLNPSYQWKKNGISTGSNSATYSDNALINQDVISCVLNSSATCLTTNNLSSNLLTMTVNANVTPFIIITSNTNNIICAGTSVTFNSAQNFGGSAPGYQWKKNGVPVGLNSAGYIDAELKNGDVIFCTMLSNANCVTTLNAISNSITMNVAPLLIPGISIMTASDSICAGSMATFTSTQMNGGSSPAYQWKLNGSNVGANSNTYSNVTLNNGDLITCVLTSNESCVTTKMTHSNELKMTVNAIKTPTIVISSNTTTITIGTKVVFTALTSNGGTNPVYQWKLNGNVVGTNSQTYVDSTLMEGDVISCVLTSNAPCLTSSTGISNSIKITLQIVSVLDQTIFKVNIFPVPSNDHIVVALIDLNASDLNVYLYNLLGQIVGKSVIRKGNTFTKFDTSALPNGEYVLKITNDIKTILKKVLILK